MRKSRDKKSESQEEGGGPGFRGIGFYRNQLFGGYNLSLFMLVSNQVKTVFTSSKIQYYLYEVQQNLHNFYNYFMNMDSE